MQHLEDLIGAVFTSVAIWPIEDDSLMVLENTSSLCSTEMSHALHGMPNLALALFSGVCARATDVAYFQG